MLEYLNIANILWWIILNLIKFQEIFKIDMYKSIIFYKAKQSYN